MNAACVAAGERLSACYDRIGRERMAGLPVCNPALAVEAVGFRALAGEAVGVLVTPWCMNLVLLGLPGAPPRSALPAGATRDVSFPVGTITLTVALLEPFGRVDAASLVSPMDAFASQDDARATALAALQTVLTPPAPVASGRRGLLFGRATASP